MRLLIATFFLLCTGALFAQPWYYDFGTATGSKTVQGGDYDFLPAAPAGTDMVYVGEGSGGFDLKNSLPSFGSDSYLRIQASSSASVNKFSVHSIPGATNLFTMRILLRLGDNAGGATSTSGVVQLIIGNGTSFSDNSQMAVLHSFTALNWEFAASKLRTSFLIGGTWSEDLGEPMQRGADYIIDIYCNNNEDGSANYEYNSSNYTLAFGKYDVWVNGVLLYSAKDKGSLVAGTPINSFMLIAHHSTTNTAHAFVDNISYTNALAAAPLPVELTSFTASSVNGTVNLNWATATEVSNYGFEVERSADESVWNKIGFVAGNGNSNSVKSYSYSDNTASSGTVYYRLKQLDTDGKYEYSKVVSVNNTTPDAFTVDQNFPNPFNPSTTIRFSLANSSNVKVDVYASNGELVHTLANKTYEAGNHAINFDASPLSAGIYLYRITAIDAAGKTFSAVKKMQLIK